LDGEAFRDPGAEQFGFGAFFRRAEIDMRVIAGDFLRAQNAFPRFAALPPEALKAVESVPASLFF
jgi:hypothetical protein